MTHIPATPQNLPELYEYITDLANRQGDDHALRVLIHAGWQLRSFPTSDAIKYLNQGIITSHKTRWTATIAGVFEYNAKKAAISSFYYPHFFDDNCYANPWWFPDAHERRMWFYFQYSPRVEKSWDFP